MQIKRVIVSGANGFVGARLCKELIDNNVEVIAIVRRAPNGADNIKQLEGIKIIECDLSEFKNLPDIISDREIDVFFHLAWIGSSGKMRSDNKVQLKNVEYTIDAIDACEKLGCRKFLFASSIMTYEIHALMEKDLKPDANTMYSAAKLSADYMARILTCSIGVEYIRAVISNVYGPGEKSPRLINTSIRKMINGEHCSFSEGKQLYDFIFISDAVRALCLLGEKGKGNRTYYVGSMKPMPLKEFLIEMRDSINPSIEIGLGEIPFNGITLGYNEFDIEAIKKDTGFTPIISFSEGIKMTKKWIEKNLPGGVVDYLLSSYYRPFALGVMA